MTSEDGSAHQAQPVQTVRPAPITKISRLRMHYGQRHVSRARPSTPRHLAPIPRHSSAPPDAPPPHTCRSTSLAPTRPKLAIPHPTSSTLGLSQLAAPLGHTRPRPL